MATLMILATETYNYKNVEVKRVDSIEEGFSTSTCYPTRTWTVNGKPAFTVKIEGETRLASYLDKEASKGGVKSILKDFTPECGFYVEMNNSVIETISALGRYVELDVVETQF